VSLYDEVTVEEAAGGIEVSCDDPAVAAGERNSCHKAAAAFLSWSGWKGGVRIAVRKRIPVEAGLGGGSSDAAAVLKAMSLLSGRIPSRAERIRMGASVGADVPFFTLGGAALAEGAGEILTPVPWSVPFHAVVVKPLFGLPTAEGYGRLRRVEGGPPPSAEAPRVSTWAELAALVSNDFEAAWADERPEIAVIKEELRALGAAASALTGSGSAVFGLFRDGEAARSAASVLSSRGDGKRVMVVRSL
jgi:4-diphosphocytidyl-2-C-methyl-D-erythritol kinase